MFRFENPDYLYILIVIPVLVLLYIGLYFQRKKRIKLLGEYALIGQLMTCLLRAIWFRPACFWMQSIPR